MFGTQIGTKRVPPSEGKQTQSLINTLILILSNTFTVSLQKDRKIVIADLKLVLAEHTNTEKVAYKIPASSHVLVSILYANRVVIALLTTDQTLSLPSAKRIWFTSSIRYFNLALPSTSISYTLFFSSPYHPNPL